MQEELKLNTIFNLAIEQKERAFYLSLAAILGDGIYNFGELVDKLKLVEFDLGSYFFLQILSYNIRY